MKFFIGIFILCMTTASWAALSGESELSLIKSGGNSVAETFGIKSKGALTLLKKHVVALSGEYNYAQSENITSKENWNIAAKYDYKLTERVSGYFGALVESDRFKGISRSYNGDLGLAMEIYHSDKQQLKGEAGYRYTAEKSVLNGYEHYSKARLFLEYNWELNNNVRAFYEIEYLPNFTESDDYLVNMTPGVEVVLAKELFLKLSYDWKYDNMPEEGKVKADYALKTSLLAKF